MKAQPPVLTDASAREHYDFLWALYPYEHREAYWLRAGPHGIVCTRCGEQLSATAEQDDMRAFTANHLSCQLGAGLDGAAEAEQDAQDPLFHEEAHDAQAADDGGDPDGAVGVQREPPTEPPEDVS